MRPFLALLRRDLKLAMRDGGALGTAMGFYLLVVAILPLGLGPDLNLLSRIAPGILWVALLLSALLSLPRMFEIDDEDGSLEVLATGDTSLELVAAAKSLAHWLSTAVPLSLMAPVLGLLLNLDLAAYPALLATLIGGTPADQLHRRDLRGADTAQPPRRAVNFTPSFPILHSHIDFWRSGNHRRADGNC